MNREAKRKLAEDLFLTTQMTQQEICNIIGWNEKTFSSNKKKYKWETLKAARTSTRESNVANMLMQLNLITEAAKKEERALTMAETNQISQLSAAIEKLDKKEKISMYVNAFIGFQQFLAETNPKLLKELVPFQKKFIEQKAAQLGIA